MNRASSTIHIAVDIGKYALDVHIHERGVSLNFENSAAGLRKLLDRMGDLRSNGACLKLQGAMNVH